MRDWSSLLHIQKAQALTVIFWISCKYTVPWRWQCKASAGNCSPWCFFVMEVQMIKFEISLMRSKVSVFFLCLSSLSLKFKVLFRIPPKRGDILCSWYYFFSSCLSFYVCIWQNILICCPLCLSCPSATFCVSCMQLLSSFAPLVGGLLSYMPLQCYKMFIRCIG